MHALLTAHVIGIRNSLQVWLALLVSSLRADVVAPSLLQQQARSLESR
jgi:hypothetical protein